MSPTTNLVQRQTGAAACAAVVAAVALLFLIALPRAAHADFATRDGEAQPSGSATASTETRESIAASSLHRRGAGTVELTGLTFVAAFAASILLFGWRDGWFSANRRD